MIEECHKDTCLDSPVLKEQKNQIGAEIAPHKLEEKKETDFFLSIGAAREPFRLFSKEPVTNSAYFY